VWGWPYILVRATKDITGGEELLANYGDKYVVFSTLHAQWGAPILAGGLFYARCDFTSRRS